MVIFSRFQTELFAYSPLSTMSYSVVDSFNLLNAIFAFCSSRGSALVLTQSPQQITAQLRSSRGGGSPGPARRWGRRRERTRRELTIAKQPTFSCNVSEEDTGPPSSRDGPRGQPLPRALSGAGCVSGLFGATLAGKAWLLSPAGQAPRDARQPQPKRKATLLQKLPLPHPRGWQWPRCSTGCSVPGAERGCAVPPRRWGDAHRHAAGRLPHAAGSWEAFTPFIQ